MEKKLEEQKETKTTILSSDNSKVLNIYGKLSAISTELMTVAKNLEVGVGANKYKGTGEADVLRAVKPLEAKYNVYSYPVSRNIIETGIQETKSGNKYLFIRIEVVYRFINIENPAEYVDITSYGDGVDSQDKSVGKAMTYADKYALMKAYKIITGDDPDQNASEDLKDTEIKLNQDLLAEAERINIDLNKLAIYLKKDASQLTNEDLKKAIAQKKKALEGVKNDK